MDSHSMILERNRNLDSHISLAFTTLRRINEEYEIEAYVKEYNGIIYSTTLNYDHGHAQLCNEYQQQGVCSHTSPKAIQFSKLTNEQINFAFINKGKTYSYESMVKIGLSCLKATPEGSKLENAIERKLTSCNFNHIGDNEIELVTMLFCGLITKNLYSKAFEFGIVMYDFLQYKQTTIKYIMSLMHVKYFYKSLSSLDSLDLIYCSTFDLLQSLMRSIQLSIGLVPHTDSSEKFLTEFIRIFKTLKHASSSDVTFEQLEPYITGLLRVLIPTRIANIATITSGHELSDYLTYIIIMLKSINND